MVDFMGAIKKPFSDMKTLGIGTILGAIPGVNLLVVGYALKVAEDTTKGDTKLRAWAVGDIIDYIIKVILMLIIEIVYYIIPVILVAVGIGGAIMTLITSLSSGITNPTILMQTVMASLATGAPLIIIGVILGIIAAIMMPMALMKWIKSGSVLAAFNVIAVIKNVLTVDYILALIVSIVYIMVLCIAAIIIELILGMIPIIGFILILLVNGLLIFLISTTMYSIIAQTVK
jgi:hypothetical protein